MKNGKRKIRTEVLRELSFLESLSRRCPQDPEILKALSDLYTQVGRFAEGLKADLDLSRLCPREPLVWYNLACSYALTARTDEALSALSHAVDLGYRDYGWIRQDSDLESIRQDQRFKALLQRLMTGKNAASRSS
ncbi:MAG: hypothetical protein KKG09_04660 [Verrucomicrobia bacterium]|nr:hypothetical protein [Verrucomicrobiota bacterium]MCG2681567.1 hypothetical protein [Kiritimatiellia bacterium]MBU4248121.1 hypothetical protein [Verrucomicrobiota bacterium]MBU4290649.1 hypothetical protein [Verrucomicrobiota bacterium]MBU4430015.1 hypothetical protein [Verrucomicrobiota bacterium]